MTGRRKPIGSADELMATAAIANVLADAAEQSLCDPLGSMETLRNRLPTSLPDVGLEYLRLAVMEMAIRHYRAGNAKKSEFTEFDVHRHFWANLNQYLPGAVRIKRESKPKHIPDGWVELDGVAMPIEIKRDAFNASAARQLSRYMTEYGATRGVAVARKIRCPRDPRVIYIECEVAAL